MFPGRTDMKWTVDERPFAPPASVPFKHSVLLLGAGSSAPASCPLMRQFIDRARDLNARGEFNDSECSAFKETLKLYDWLRRNLHITEEDIDNIETLLSLSDLAEAIGIPLADGGSENSFSPSLRRFVDAVITRSMRVDEPKSPAWLLPVNELSVHQSYKGLGQAIACLGENVTIINLNYDCLIEHTCHCLGLPFTYDRDEADGVEILKLHGSLNWLRCENPACCESGKLTISSLRFVKVDEESSKGYVARIDEACQQCSRSLVPLIIPPTWSKDIRQFAIQKMWRRAAEALHRAENFVAIGYSLPSTDAHVRQLLNLGLRSGSLRQAVVLVGEDEAAAERWSALFRPSWRSSRLEVRMARLQRVIGRVVLPALVVSEELRKYVGKAILPLAKSLSGPKSLEQLIIREADSTRVQGELDLAEVMHHIREGHSLNDRQSRIASVLREKGLVWEPSETIPAPHTSFASTENS